MLHDSFEAQFKVLLKNKLEYKNIRGIKISTGRHTPTRQPKPKQRGLGVTAETGSVTWSSLRQPYIIKGSVRTGPASHVKGARVWFGSKGGLTEQAVYTVSHFGFGLLATAFLWSLSDCHHTHTPYTLSFAPHTLYPHCTKMTFLNLRCMSRYCMRYRTLISVSKCCRTYILS